MATATQRTVLERLGIEPVINACGIYTDFGGSILAPEVWAAATEVNGVWASIPELLDRTGERVAELVGTPAGRIVPGASAAISLATAACIARGDGDVSERLPLAPADRSTEVVMQRGHRYKYGRCALLGGGTITEVDTPDADAFAAALAGGPAAVLHPAHLDARPGCLPLADVVKVAHEHGVPVIVDAAYLSFPLDLITELTGSGADLVCFSAKYFHGPNAGGLLVGRADLIDAVREVDFTRYETGTYLNYGRALKMDRATIVATVVAFERWLTLDHDERWTSYRRRVDALVARFRDEFGLDARGAQFTLDERVIDAAPNAVVLRVADAPGLERELLAGTPRIAAIGMDGELVLAVETVAEEDDAILAETVAAAARGR